MFPPGPAISPQVRRKQLAASGGVGGGQPQMAPQPQPQPDARRRPMSFVRALEMSDAVELAGSGAALSGGQQQQQQPRPDTPDRASVYDMNYEISV